MTKLTFKLLLALSLIFVVSCDSEPKNTIYADMIIKNAVLYTADDSTSTSADAIAVIQDTIYKIGTTAEINKLAGPSTEVIDAKGKFVMPGLNDSHLHFIGLGKSKLNVALQDEGNWNEIILKVMEASQKTGFRKWIVGRGWHQEKWNMLPDENVNGYPTYHKLSRAVSKNPVLLVHASGHAIFANKMAMELAGIDDSTKAPDGGTIVRDYNGEAIGVFEENAADLIWAAYNKENNDNDKEYLTRCIKLASEECLKFGITSIGDAGVSLNTIDLYKELADSGKLDVRMNVMIYADNQSIDKWASDPEKRITGSDFLTVNSIKVYMDGALGSRGAWLLEPYADLEDHTGHNVTELKTLRKTAEIAAKHGLQLCTHAIGDKANKETINLYERAFKKHGNKDYRWRIEHTQHLDPADIKKMKKYDIVASMQGIHCTSDAPFVLKRLGEERAEKTSYLWKDILDAGVVISNGTDAPVESVDPYDCIYASVTREYDGGKIFFGKQKMTRDQALKSYTKAGAYVTFEEDRKGTLTEGKLADIIILDRNLLTTDAASIKSTKVLYTIVGGKVKYSSD